MRAIMNARRREDHPGDVAPGEGELRGLLSAGELDLPLPRGGRRAERWSGLAGWGRRNLALARLVEGHTDAVAILAEAARHPRPETLYGDAGRPLRLRRRFPPDGPGEDHGLWRRLDEAGYRLTCPTTVRVRTSARLRGRAAGGLADLLRSLDSDRGARERYTSRCRNYR